MWIERDERGEPSAVLVTAEEYAKISARSYENAPVWSPVAMEALRPYFGLIVRVVEKAPDWMQVLPDGRTLFTDGKSLCVAGGGAGAGGDAGPEGGEDTERV